MQDLVSKLTKYLSGTCQMIVKLYSADFCLAREWNHHWKSQASTIQLVTGEMTQSVMELGTQPEDVASIPGTHMVEEN